MIIAARKYLEDGSPPPQRQQERDARGNIRSSPNKLKSPTSDLHECLFDLLFYFLDQRPHSLSLPSNDGLYAGVRHWLFFTLLAVG